MLPYADVFYQVVWHGNRRLLLHPRWEELRHEEETRGRNTREASQQRFLVSGDYKLMKINEYYVPFLTIDPPKSYTLLL